MNKFIPFLVSCTLLTGVFGCQESPKAGTQTPNPSIGNTAKPASNTTQTTDKTTKLSPVIKTTSDLKSEVTQKLKQGLPGNKLEVENKAGEIILKGTATSQEELTKAETLAKQVKGVKTVKVETKLEPAKKP
ncbi:BON domain-containing protein [Cronbergia sp. UHCC 0137]|uniref:BON domain-containing protein n=1 Tax=Cronbergia sp. UHCC 0137 TaxID=3110239 RepID=UPI002B1F6C57|nr:BON domain-containing protein [Cronbergia sp. UHCC 0137]MEA5619611.1 BON domain-containing protein [Cronbergia sp. UHCC 0137]